MKRKKLTDSIKDEKVVNVDRMLFSREGKKELIEELHITETYLRAVLRSLRSGGILIGNTINPVYLLDWEPGKPFRWVFIFKNEIR